MDDSLISLAGPGINLLLAVGLLLLVHVGEWLHSEKLQLLLQHTALLSVFLAFFNLLPIPPLDGSHVLKNLVAMSEEFYWRLCQFGVLMVLIAFQIPLVQSTLFGVSIFTLNVMARLTGVA